MQAHLRQPTSNTWTELAPLGVSRANLAGAVLDGQFYAIRGRHSLYASTVTVYNPVSNTWKGVKSMHTARGGLAAAVLNGTIYAMGGSNSGGPNATVEAYSPKTGSWTSRSLDAELALYRHGLGRRRKDLRDRG